MSRGWVTVALLGPPVLLPRLPRGSGDTIPRSRKRTWLKLKTGLTRTSHSTGLNTVSPRDKSA